ncbi:MAG: hypothetical protein LBH18_03065 [Spirochaetaceae bacterium]|jgi:hypothetical protein|nr:hypothetical protein [Spirochaetaceae bacterium]
MIRFATFLYDALRFFIMIFLLLGTLPQLDNSDNYFFSPVLCAVPLALFPLMTFFLWLDREKYKVFAPLYAAGKIVSICAALAIFFSSFREFISVCILLDARKIILNLTIPILVLLDILFLLPVILSMKQARTTLSN